MSRSPRSKGPNLPVRILAGGLSLVLLASSALQAQGTSAGTRIPNVAVLRFQTAGGQTLADQSDTALVIVGKVGRLGLEASRQDSAYAGAKATFSHRLSNRQNAADSVTLVAASRRGWAGRLFRDLNGNGALDTGEPPIVGSLAVSLGAVEGILLEVDIPAGTAAGTADTITVRVTSQSDAAVTDSVVNVLIARTAAAEPASLSLTHVADALEVRLGGVAPLTMTVTNTAASALTDVWLESRLPAGGVYVPGSGRGADSVVVRSGNVSFLLRGDLAPAMSRRVSYAAAVVAAQSQELDFVARASARGGAVVSAEAGVRVRVARGIPMQTRAAIGKVWVDANLNGRQDAGENGVPGVDVMTTDGDLASTDAEGRFSFSNLRTGRHAFRVDPATIPLEYRLPQSSAGDVVIENQTGWTSSRADFALVPRMGQASRLLKPLQWSITVRRAPALDGPAARVGDVPCGAAIANVRLVTSVSAGAIPCAAGEPERVSDAAPVSLGYQMSVRNAGSTAARALVLSLSESVDSAAVADGGTIIARSQGRRLPPVDLAPREEVQLLVWASSPGAISLSIGGGSSELVPMASFEKVLGSFAGVTAPVVVIDTIPDGARGGFGGIVEMRLEAPAAGWPGEAVALLPEGWEPEAGTVRVGDTPLPDPELRTERSGRRYLYWSNLSGTNELRFILAPGTRADHEIVSVPPLRTPSERESARGADLIAGPGVAIFAPTDGVVTRTDHVFVGVRGEPGAPVTLFDGDSAISRGVTRPDGVHDFVSIALASGPHRLRVQMKNSWGQLRWDSAMVHVSGLTATIAPALDSLRLVADGHSVASLRARLADRWGVPVVTRPLVTASGERVRVTSPDGDGSQVGTQVRADSAGWVEVTITAPRDAGMGAVELHADSGHTTVPVTLLPDARPLLVTGAGLVGLGAAQEGYASVTAQGRLDDRTALSLTYDSRRLDAGRENFGRTQDPLESSQYPLLGDGGERRSAGASRYRLSARMERGQDWLALGDLTTHGFATATQLTSYRRSLAGAATRLSTGAVEWQGFVSSTQQRLGQVQLRGNGSSGPYLLDGDIVPGTELVRLESRAPENAARVTTQQAMVRFLDYQIDYERGTLLFKQPVTAVDPYGNPLFVVVTFETLGAGARHATWGVRAVGDARRSLGLRSVGLDSLLVGGTVVRDGAVGGVGLTGADVSLVLRRALTLRGEVSRSQAADSTGLAASLKASLQSADGAWQLSGGWTRIGQGFANPANIALRGGDSELKVAASYRKNGTDFTLEHEEQTFGSLGVRRARTSGGVTQSLTKALKVEARMADDRFNGTTGAAGDATLAQELKLSWAATSRLGIWGEGRRQLTRSTNSIRPDAIGAGASFALTPDVSLEARHRQVAFAGDGPAYAITNLGVRARVARGTDAWSSYQLAGANGAYNAAIVGLNNRLTLGSDWALNTMFERRQGVGRSFQADPVRALPFLQQEEDYWTLGGGAEFIRKDAPYRLSGRGEHRDGAARSSRIFTLAGDVSLNRSLALLSRQELLRSRQTLVSTPLSTHQASSLWGLAYRPAASNTLNLLGKFEWIDAANPAAAGVLVKRGNERRIIGALEGIWTPSGSLELTARFATRRSVAAAVSAEPGAASLRETADFIGWRTTFDLSRHVALRTDGRWLAERSTRTSRWDVAPQLVVLPAAALEVAVGVRMGDLRDPDFAAAGGRGAFVTFGTRFTERAVTNVASYWRKRFNGEMPQ